jgi:hypothetical protein
MTDSRQYQINKNDRSAEACDNCLVILYLEGRRLDSALARDIAQSLHMLSVYVPSQLEHGIRCSPEFVYAGQSFRAVIERDSISERIPCISLRPYCHDQILSHRFPSMNGHTIGSASL